MAKLILIPGLGANRLLFEPQRHALDQTLFFPDWQQPIFTQVEGKKPVPETLRDYARRWADRWVQTILSKPEVRNQFWLGGVSFGGMIALEAAARLVEEKCPPRGVFLIASCRSAAAISMGFKMQQRLGALIPTAKLPSAIRFITRHIAKKEGLSDLDAHLLKKISAEADINMLRWGGRACIEWKHTEADAKSLERAGVSIHQIHGDADWVIAMTRGHPDKVIRGGRHLINITHADEVNQYIISRMKSDLAGD